MCWTKCLRIFTLRLLDKSYWNYWFNWLIIGGFSSSTNKYCLIKGGIWGRHCFLTIKNTSVSFIVMLVTSLCIYIISGEKPDFGWKSTNRETKSERILERQMNCWRCSSLCGICRQEEQNRNTPVFIPQYSLFLKLSENLVKRIHTHLRI